MKKQATKKKPSTEPRKPGPIAGAKNETMECPYCGGKCHRKNVLKLKSEDKPYRRYYCIEGCGHYHYRTLDTNAIVEVGEGPRECKLHSSKESSVELDRLRKQIEQLKKNPGPVVGVIEKTVEKAVQFEQEIAKNLQIDASSLVFTAKTDSGRPRVIINCLSAGDIAALETEGDRDTVQQLHRALLTIQACIGAYRDKAQVAIKSAKGKIQ